MQLLHEILLYAGIGVTALGVTSAARSRLEGWRPPRVVELDPTVRDCVRECTAWKAKRLKDPGAAIDVLIAECEWDMRGRSCCRGRVGVRACDGEPFE
jgi:hypothetical protein